MSRTFADYLAPVGNIIPDHFPGEDATTIQGRATAYIAEANTKITDLTLASDIDLATDHWVYYRFWDAIYSRLVAQANSNAIADEGSASITVQQIRDVKALRDEELAAFNGMVTQSLASAKVSYGPTTTRITP